MDSVLVKGWTIPPFIFFISTHYFVFMVLVLMKRLFINKMSNNVNIFFLNISVLYTKRLSNQLQQLFIFSLDLKLKFCGIKESRKVCTFHCKNVPLRIWTWIFLSLIKHVKTILISTLVLWTSLLYVIWSRFKHA